MLAYCEKKKKEQASLFGEHFHNAKVLMSVRTWFFRKLVHIDLRNEL